MDAPQQASPLKMRSVIGARVARTQEFLVIMKIECIEVDTLLSFDLHDRKPEYFAC